MNSQIGFKPPIAAPAAIPAKPISVIGVSITLLSPYFFHNPLVTLYAPSYWATSSPRMKTFSSVSVLLPQPSRDFVCSVILGNFLTQNENLFISLHLFIDSCVQRISYSKLGAGGH